jgi:hypothetical protein
VSNDRTLGSGTIPDRVRRAFPDESSLVFASQFVESLRASMKDIAEVTRRAVILGLLTAAMFELINRAAVVDVAIGPLRVQDLSLIHKVLPVIFSYLVYDASALALRYVYCEKAYFEIMDLTHHDIRQSGLDYLSLPFTPSLFGPFLVDAQNRLERAAIVLRRIFRVTALLSSLAVELYLVTKLLTIYGYRDFLTWCAALLSVAVFTCGAMVYVVILRVRGDITR